jgi:hypothetical protein
MRETAGSVLPQSFKPASPSKDVRIRVPTERLLRHRIKSKFGIWFVCPGLAARMPDRRSACVAFQLWAPRELRSRGE